MIIPGSISLTVKPHETVVLRLEKWVAKVGIRDEQGFGQICTEFFTLPKNKNDESKRNKYTQGEQISCTMFDLFNNKDQIENSYCNSGRFRKR